MTRRRSAPNGVFEPALRRAPVVDVAPADRSEQETVASLLQLYLHDLSQFHDEIRPGPDGRFPYAYADAYWQERTRHPFLIRADGEIAGLAFVRGLQGFWIMAEFFVVQRWRRTGVGSEAATQLFRRFPGPWIVHELRRNLGAQAFWRQLARAVADGGVEETETTDGFTQRFLVSRPAGRGSPAHGPARAGSPNRS